MGHDSGRRALAAVTIAAFGLIASVREARAADPTAAECIAANDAATKARSEGRLLDAREALIKCASPKCPASVREECEKDVDDVNRALPTIVFEPKDAAGSDVLTPVKVSMDGKPLSDKLDGRAISVDPGTHEFTFETSGQAPVKKTLMIHESEKDRREVIAFGGGAAQGAAGTPPATTTGSPGTAAPPQETAAPAPAAGPSSSPEQEGPSPSGLEIGLASGYMLPLGSVDATSGDDLSNFVNGAIPIRVHVGWRFLSPNIFVGGYLAYAFSSVPTGNGTEAAQIGCGTNSISCSAHVLLYGIEGEFHVMPRSVFDPWVGLGIGFENTTIDASGPGGSGSVGATGWDYVTLTVGGDYKPLANLGVGPFVGLTLGQFGNVNTNLNSNSSNASQNSSASITSTSLHEWVTIGLRGVYDINLNH